MRIRSKWQSGNASLEDNANALAYIVWQIALEQTKNLHREDFIYDSDHQRTGVLSEYLCYLVHVADRIIYPTLAEDARAVFVQTLANGVARHYQRNMEDVFGRDRVYRDDWIARLNLRIQEYSELNFPNREPGYQMNRSLGRHIQDLMGESQTNRWIIDQVMDVDAKTAVLELKKGIDNLFGSTSVLGRLRAPE